MFLPTQDRKQKKTKTQQRVRRIERCAPYRLPHIYTLVGARCGYVHVRQRVEYGAKCTVNVHRLWRPELKNG